MKNQKINDAIDFYGSDRGGEKFNKVCVETKRKLLQESGHFTGNRETREFFCQI